MKIVLAYSGGLDTSVIIQWLKDKYQAQIIAFIADLGQGEDIEAIRLKALKTGASDAVVADLREEFVRDFVFECVKANAVYEGTYFMGTSMARPVIAKYQVETAKEFKTKVVSHGATGKGNDQVRFELTCYALMPDVRIIAPWREWEFKSRSDLIAYASAHGIPVPVTKEKPYSSDANLFHISYEGGILEDVDAAPPEDMFKMTVSPKSAPDKETEVTVEFIKGVSVSVNGQRLSAAGLLCELNKLGGQNGIGRADVVENRYVGMKSRGVYETPGGTILHCAHRALESITMDREVMHIRDSLIPRFSELVYYGYWYSPEMEALRAFIDKTQENVTGSVKIALYKGNCIIRGRRSPKSLYNPGLATFEEDTGYRQKDAEGFIRLNALRLMQKKILGIE